MTTEVRSVQWIADGDGIRIIDQRQLPERLVERDLRTVDDVAEAIRTLAVRGAPAIGIAGAMGVALAGRMAARAKAPAAAIAEAARDAAAQLRATRPTAVNLPAALDRMLGMIARGSSGDDLAGALEREAVAILEEERAMCRKIGEHALTLISDHSRIATHCNAGALATGGIGTALAPVYLAAERGWAVEVIAGETRPLFQGSRLTAWELGVAGIPVTVVADGAMASMLREGTVTCCIVGADRIAANGDVANKIGTYALAIAARHHDVPFYVAAPTSTVDVDTPNGSAMTIEERDGDEIANGFGRRTAPENVQVRNPAFDVTPAELISAIITDKGIFRAPYDFSAVQRANPAARVAVHA